MAKDNKGYSYDVFISYPHGATKMAMWVEHIFLSHFTDCLTESVGRTARVYFDKHYINPGDKWEWQFKTALAETRILVPIWSIKYFLSLYCRAELAVMLHRQERLGYGQTGGLIVPVRIWGSNSNRFPEIAQQIEPLECGSYGNLRTDSDSSQLQRFEDHIAQWVPNLAAKIDSVPFCDPEWNQSQWLDDPINRIEETKILWPPKEKEYFGVPSIGWGEDK